MIEIIEVQCSKLILHFLRESFHETVSFLLVGGDIFGCILCEIVELVHVVHYGLVALLEVAKLLPLDIHHTLGDVECTEGRAELRPSEVVSGGLHVEMTLPPRTDGILELVRGVENLLMLLAPNESKLLLD